VPLILRVPGWKPRRVQGMVGLADVMPTLLDLLRVEPAPRLDLEGASLVPALTRGGEPQRQEVISYAQVHAERMPPGGPELDSERAILGLRTERWKVVRLPGKTADIAVLYDLGADPGERHDVAEEHSDLRDRMLARLAARIDPRRRGTPTESDRRLEEQLRSLGYIDN